MNDSLFEYYDAITKASDILYRYFDGQKKTHSEIVEQAGIILNIVLHDCKTLPKYKEILDEVVDNFEIEVGIKTYDPFIIAKDKRSNFWLYKAKPTIRHSFFDRYKLYLRKEGFTLKAIENIELTCEKILSYCANPHVETEKEQKRGLVVGDVQSGKTANYLGLMNMAYDYGYKIVVLLAGMTDSLRIQTQKRTDKGVIGAKSDTIGNTIEYCGVGLATSEHFVVPFTNQGNDFARFIQRNLNAAISDIRKPVVLVVKKNKRILESVIERLQTALKDFDSRSILIIDDEADNASISTSKPGKDPTSINRCIRGIFNKFPIASYVGFTATPFANIFINPIDEDDSNLDLFPSDFIVQLNAPDNYFGGRKVFPNGDVALPRPIRLLDEQELYFLPVQHSKDDEYPFMADSLRESIHCFLINNVIRTLRGQKNKHRSMMINISRFNDIQEKIWERVQEYINTLTNIIEQTSSYSTDTFLQNRYMQEIYDLYNSDDFYKDIREGTSNDGYPPVLWSEIQEGLYDEIKQITIAVVNSRNGKMNQIGSDGKNERFDYEKYEDVGARVIAIGGMVLSRGLTLEGLMVSYYSRNAGTYDTLLQMCRWFGYRPKYEDLCRVYLSQINIDRFDAVLDAVADLKEQFAEMDRQGKTPREFGLMVKESPDSLETTLLVTSRNKMYHTDTIEYHLNYGGVYADTSKLLKTPATNKHNLKAVSDFLGKISLRKINDRYMQEGVSKFEIAELIKNIKIPYVNKKFDTEGLSEYIENSEIFPYWDVIISTGDSDIITPFVEGEKLPAVQRSFHTRDEQDLYIRIGGSNNRVLDPGILNCGLWLTDDDRARILEEKNAVAEDGRHYTELTAKDYLKRRERPMLVIYPIDLKTDLTTEEKRAAGLLFDEVEKQKKDIKQAFGEDLLVAFAVAFPEKESKVMVNYRANAVKLEELINGLEVDDEDEGVEDTDD